MHEMIARLNIEHFKKLLSEPIDDVKRATVTMLLAEEQKKLAALTAKRKAKGGNL